MAQTFELRRLRSVVHLDGALPAHSPPTIQEQLLVTGVWTSPRGSSGALSVCGLYT